MTPKVKALKSRYKIRVNDSPTLGSGTDSHPNWENALQWLQRRHSGAVSYTLFRPSQARANFTPDMLLLGAMFLLVAKMRDKPWGEVKELVEEHHRVLMAIDPRWTPRKAGQ